MKQKRERHTPPESPLNGGIKSTIPLPWRGAAFAAGRVLFISHSEPSLFEGVRISSDTTPVILSGAFPRQDLIFSLFKKV